jgi:hypothetical protein
MDNMTRRDDVAQGPGPADPKWGRPASQGLTSGPRTPNLQPKHRLTPPINTLMLPLEESVKKVKFSFL